jgi:RNA polymerase sigma-70 factor (ECF subfamily)
VSERERANHGHAAAAHRYEQWDGAYVLGTLSPEETAEFEAHLAGCAECRARVAELSGMPALLGSLPPEAFAEPDPAVPDTLLPALLRDVRRGRRRRVLAAGVLGAAAAAVIALVIGLWPESGSTGRQMTPLAASPVSATAAFVSKPWGTEIDLVCHYRNGTGYGAKYSLVVIDKSGQSHDAGSWGLTPGKATEFTGGTSLPEDAIASIEITYHDQPILRLDR